MNNDVKSLIECRKVITKKPHKEMYNDKQHSIYLRNDFECKSEDGKYIFSVFMRISSEIESMFSIGLRVESVNSQNGNKDHIGLTILRCNGKHEHKNSMKNKNKFNDFHVHMLEDQQFLQGQGEPIDAEPNPVYNNFNDALRYFFTICNISNYEQFFSIVDLRQLTIMESENYAN